MADNTKPETNSPVPRAYFPLYKAVDRVTGSALSAPLLSYDIAEEGGIPKESYGLAEAIMAVFLGEADAVGDEHGAVIFTRDRCERLVDLSLLLEGKHSIPEELLSLKRWIIWKMLWDKEKSKFLKPPHSPLNGTGIGATVQYEAHFVDFESAVASAMQHNADGVGFVFLDSDPYVGIDFDDCIADGAIHSEVEMWFRWFHSYTEVSPSGTGLHILCRGSIAKSLVATPLPATEGATVELYAKGRYFTVTGRRVGEHTTVRDCQAGIVKLFQHLKIDVMKAPSTAPKNESIFSPYQVRRLYKDKLNELRKAREGAGNATLNSTALIAARVCASAVFDKTDVEFKQELLDIVTREWASPHDEGGARSTIDSGWRKGSDEGPYRLHSCAVAVTSEQYCAEAPKESPYIVSGLLYQGTGNQLMGPIKDGKTTFILTMINNVLAGSDFIGQKTQPTNILYVTEQPRLSFQNQLTRAGLDRQHLLAPRAASLYVLDLGHLWNLNWEGRVDTIRENADKLNIGLVIIDTFPRIALVEEIQDAGEMNKRFELIAPLIVADNRTLLLGWHERKAGGLIAEAAAGTAASGGAVDMLIRLRRSVGSKLQDRKRQLELVGRLPTAFEESTVIELKTDMSNYHVIGNRSDAVRKNVEQQILDVLPRDLSGLTMAEIMEKLTATAAENDLKTPSESTVTRAREKLLQTGIIKQTGEGGQGKRGSNDPYRYHLAAPY